MGRAVELVTGLQTAPGAGGVVYTPLTGNSFSIRDSKRDTWLIAAWQRKQAVGFSRITSPLLHDTTVGIQMTGPIGVTPLLRSYIQRLHAQDTLTLFGSGSAVAGDIDHVAMLIYYEDLPGVDARLITYDELQRRGEDIYAWQNTITAGATGQYTGSEAINAEQDQFKANRDYALVGYTISPNACAAVRWLGVDTGNLGVGGPGDITYGGNREQLTWFEGLSKLTGLPLIPVINAANKSLTNMVVVQDENAAAVNVTSQAVLLSPR